MPLARSSLPFILLILACSMTRSVLITLILMISGPASYGQQVELSDDTVAYLILEQKDRRVKCWVKIIDPVRRFAQLVIKDTSDPLAEPLIFDPDFNHLKRMFSLDLTRDDQDELVSVWTHGNATQLAVHTLEPRARLVFRAVFRHDVDIETNASTGERTIALLSSDTGGSEAEILVRRFIWSSSEKSFVEKKLGQKRSKSCATCFEVSIPQVKSPN